MEIESLVFKNNKLIPSKYTCDGENVNPPLLIGDVPENAKSLVLIVDDPDASRGTWVHWTVWNIGPHIKEIKENSCPQNAVEGRTDFGRPGYGGPCPPSGTHRYFFKLFALNTTLDIDTSTEAADLEREIEDNILAKAQLVGLYRR
ncbi:MAG TPA: YbhB/YbcL family Raf kinase inhibitor-like protein [Candidatus Humimicrobiaceae bacterium]